MIKGTRRNAVKVAIPEQPAWVLLFAVGLLVVIGSTGTLAEPIPLENIQAQHESCVAGCVKAGVPANFCEDGCTCYDQQVQKNFTFEEFKIMDRAVDDNPGAPNFPPALSAKLDAVTRACQGTP
jgi:hypothetical protein